MERSERLIVLLDVDDVLANFNKMVCCLAWEYYRVKIEKSDIKSWDWIVEKLGKPRAYKLFRDAWDEEVWGKHGVVMLPVEENLASIVEKMREIANVVVATGRQGSKDSIAVLNWLGNQKIEFDGFVSVNIRRIRKDDMLKYDAIIDDGPHNIEAAAKKGLFAFPRNQPWNAKIRDSDRIRRIWKLDESLKHLERIDEYGELNKQRNLDKEMRSVVRKEPKAEIDRRLQEGRAKARRI